MEWIIGILVVVIIVVIIILILKARPRPLLMKEFKSLSTTGDVPDDPTTATPSHDRGPVRGARTGRSCGPGPGVWCFRKKCGNAHIRLCQESEFLLV